MELSSWLGNIKDDVKLNRIVLPATHDSGMSSASHAKLDVLNPFSWALAKPIAGLVSGVDDMRNPRRHKFFHDNFTTQLHDVAGQLACGARQFDLRITRHNGTYRAYHGHYGFKLVGMRRYGEKWADVCTAIAEFMALNGKTEFLILKLDKQSNYTTKMMRMLSDALTKADYGPHLHGHMRKKWVDQEDLKTLRGRILICGKDGLKYWSKMQQMHPSLTLCRWKKDETGSPPDDAKLNEVKEDYPIYLLLGGAKAKNDKDHDKWDNVLEKQEGMKKAFEQIIRTGTVGMRGIWFNTYSILRDIRVFAEEIWGTGAATRRERLWIGGLGRQNVASLDFLDETKGCYVVLKNDPKNWVPEE